jgi:hypothetical protein
MAYDRSITTMTIRWHISQVYSVGNYAVTLSIEIAVVHCSFGLPVTIQQYFSVKTNQHHPPTG